MGRAQVIIYEWHIMQLLCSVISFSEVTSSQPACTTEGARGVDATVAMNSFTQPSRFDELIIGTQIPCTPGASQVCMIS